MILFSKHLYANCIYALICTLAFLSIQSLAAADERSNRSKPDDQVAARLSPEEGGPRRFQIDIEENLRFYADTSSDAKILDSLSGNVVLINLGCELIAETEWCYVKPLRRNLKGYVLGKYLVPAVAPDGTIPMGVNTSAKRVRKRDFDAKEQIACAQIRGQALSQCSAQIARSGGGDAAVVVTFSNDFKRTLYFMHGEFTSANATMSGVGTDVDWKIESDHFHIRVDDQRYVIPVTFILG